MTTHVFIVDSTTFRVHLENLFAGTGAKDNVVDFNNSQNTSLHSTTENMLVGMTADANRIRRGDTVIFYLQQDFAKNIYEGKFFGIFEAQEDWSFLDNNDGEQYLRGQLLKSLTFRTLIKPFRVYPEGVTEWEALDEIRHIQSPNQMLWSLIYRKLKGNRGNTMITIYESERLCQLIRDKNTRQEININNHRLTFDQTTQRIIVTNDIANNYTGRKEDINLLPRLIAKYRADRSFEAHLQSYIVKNIGKGINRDLDNCVLDSNTIIEWLGNEVSCGVGMQRIDIMLSVTRNGQRIVIPVELKAVEASVTNTKQLQRYIDWIEQYYTPNRQSDIQPVLVAKKIEDKNGTGFRDIIRSFVEFNTQNSRRCNCLKYIEYYVDNSNLIFNNVNYNL